MASATEQGEEPSPDTSSQDTAQVGEFAVVHDAPEPNGNGQQPAPNGQGSAGKRGPLTNGRAATNGAAQPPPDSTVFLEVSEEEVRTTSPDVDQEEVRGLALPHRYYRRRFQRQNATDTTPPVETPVIQSDTIEDGRSFSRRMRQLIFGKPIASAEFEKEHIGVFKALAVLSSDALSSVAYGTEASLAVLVTAGVTEASHNLLIGLTVVLLLSVVAFSYRQTIFTYPKGGGSYIVAKDNLNVNFGLIAASALMIDYILTVSVSVSAGVLALVAPFPELSHFKVVIGVGLILFLMFVNMRGVSESGSIFAAPTYLFVGSFLFMILIGVGRAIFNGGLLHAVPPAATNILPTGHLSAFLILTAFSSGCSAMTGTEAISDGVPIFRKPQSTNAAKTLLIMAILLGVMYGGTTFLAWRFGISPQLNGEPTLTYQMAELFFHRSLGWFPLIFQLATTLILVLAANTSFADFPRLSMFLARDEYLPHFFSMQGDRLVYSTGILVLGVLSIILLIVFGGNTEALINLYALGVFVAFTMSQSGMVRRWWTRRPEGWRHKFVINLIGSFTTLTVTIIIAVSKFDRGAWVVVILIPLMFAAFKGVHHHYQLTKEAILHVPVPRRSSTRRHLVVVPIARLDNLALRGLYYARSLSRYVVVLHVSLSPEDTTSIKAEWETLLRNERLFRSSTPVEDFGDEVQDWTVSDKLVGTIAGPKLIVVDSAYRELTRPIINFIDELEEQHPDDFITVVLPEFVARHFWEPLLHNQTVLWLKLKLLNRPHIVTASVPYRLGGDDDVEEEATPTPTPVATP